MSNLSALLISVSVYVLCARLTLSLSKSRGRSVLFALINIAAFAWISLLVSFSEWNELTIIDLGSTAIFRQLLLIGGYIVFVIPGYFLLRELASGKSWRPWLAFSYPILLLISVKYFRFPVYYLQERFDWENWVTAMAVVGVSYMAFRLSFLVIEVRNGLVTIPSLSQYLGFAFFLPTLVMGPINPYSAQQRSIETPDSGAFPPARCFVRIIVGGTKFIFLANLTNQLTYAGIFLDEKPHSLIDLPIAAVFYYLFLYLNFSGFCDMAIGIAGLVGIKVRENFNNPFVAKNVKDFWNRWHITLSEYVRDVIFAPVSKALIKKFGPGSTNLSISASVVIVFLVIGVWHGVGWRFAIFGLIHAFGVVANIYYTTWMKRVLGRERYAAYNKNPIVDMIAMGLTFGYVSASFLVFANDWEMLGIIRHALIDGSQL